MISLGLNATEQAAFHRTLHTSHYVDVTVRVLDKNRAYLTDISEQLFDGQVNIDADADVSRSCTLSLRDPGRALAWDSSNPNDGALFLDRMVQVIYTVTSPDKQAWSVPIFTGPITKVSRTVDVVNVEAQGIEQTMLDPTVAWFARTYKKGTKRTELVRRLLADYGGETRFTIPDWPERTTKDAVMVYSSSIWKAARYAAGPRGTNHLFYDGRGVAVLRRLPKASVFAFREGAGGNITSAPQVDYDVSEVRNKVRMTGATPKGAKTPVVGVATAPAGHPLSTRSLGRGGKERILLAEVQDDDLKTAKEATAAAKDELDRLLLQSVDVSFDALVIPHLEPEDVYTITTPTLSLTARLRKATIPLKEGTMTVGYNAKRSTNATRIRRRK